MTPGVLPASDGYAVLEFSPDPDSPYAPAVVHWPVIGFVAERPGDDVAYCGGVFPLTPSAQINRIWVSAAADGETDIVLKLPSGRLLSPNGERVFQTHGEWVDDCRVRADKREAAA